MRMMIVCHDSVGIGHLRRSLAIAERASETIPTCRSLVVSGTLHVTHFSLPERVDFVKLPSVCKGPDYRYAAKTLGIEFEQLLAVRSAVLTATAASFRPDVFLIDKSPVGIRGEALTALRLLKDRSPRTRVIFGMRDIEDAPERTRGEWRRGGHFEALSRWVDEIWVYGDQELFDVADAYRMPPDLADRIRYVGYIARSPCRHAPIRPSEANGAKHVLITVGGGTDGFRLIDQYLSCPVLSIAGAPVSTTIVGGPDLAREHAERFRQRAAEFKGVKFEDVVPCMGCAYRQADAIVCMGGYNTMVEVIQTETPVLVYPRVVPRLEQYIRAKCFAERGYCDALDPNRMTPESLNESIARLLGGAAPQRSRLPDLDGLGHVTDRLSQIECGLRDRQLVWTEEAVW